MAAEIELKIQNQQALEAVKAVLNEVKNLEDQGTKISLGDIKKYTALVNATKKVSSAERELENQTNARLRAQLTAQRIATEEARTLKEIANAHKSQANAIKATDQAQNQLNKTMTSGVGLAKNMGSAMMSFTKQLIGFYGVTSTLRKAFTEMKAMNDELVTYRKVTGASAADMQKMQSAAYSAAKQYGQSPSDFLASAATMARAGYKENSAAMAELATKTQLVGDMTADQASKFLIAVDAAYKYQGNIKQLSSVLDSANEIDNRYATTIEKISEGMTLVASVAATAEVPIEQLMAALGTMTAVTQREGSEAARGLRYILLHAMGDTTTEIEAGVTATEEGIQTLNEAVMKYGDESAKAALKAGKMINPMEKIVALQKAWKEGTISKESLYDIGLKVAGQRQYNMFMALIQNPEMYNSMMKDIANSAGSADKEWQAMMDSWSKKLEKLKATFTELVNNTISTDFIKSLIDAGTGALEFAGNLENLATMATGAYAAIKALSAGIGNLSKNQKFGSFNGLGIGLGLAVSAIGIIKSEHDRVVQAAADAAQKAADKAKTAYSTYESLIKISQRYKEINEDGIVTESEKNELISMQSEINNLLGDQAKSIDIVNGKYGDMSNAISNALEGQKKLTEEEFNSALAAAYIAFAKRDITPGIDNYGSRTGFKLPYNFDGTTPAGIKTSLSDIEGFDKYFSWTTRAENFGPMQWVLQLTKPTTQEGMLEFYGILTKVQKTLNDAGKAFDGKTFAEAYSNSYEAITQMISEMDAAGVKAVYDISQAKKEAESLADVGALGASGSSGDASGFKAITGSVITLADAIKQATAAKNAFDEAMKTSKADAFNDYTKAFQTLKKEMDAGRVNSNAFYAAAEMLMGEEAYAATGGESEAVRKAMKKRTKGDSGSAYDAWQILSKKYYNKKTGEEIEGFGFAELLRQTKGWGEKKITDKDGNIVIPSLTPEQIADIANAWHVDSAFLMAAWNAFDQYDKNGTRQQDDLMDRVQETSEDAAEGEKTLAESETQAASAVDSLAKSANDAAGAIGSLADAVNAEDNTSAQEDSIRGGSEKDLRPSEEIYKDFVVNLTLAQSSTEDAKTILAVINALNKEGGYTLDITSGGATDVTSGKVTTIEAALQAIENMKKDGVITADVAGELKGHLLADLEQLGFAVDKFKENPPEIEINGNADGALDTVKNLETEVEQEHQFKVSDGVSEELMRDVDKIDDATLQLQRAYTLSVADGNKVDSSKLNTILATTAELGKNYTFNVTNGEGVAAAEATIDKLENAIKLVSGMASSGLISEDDAAKLTAGFQGVIDSLSKSIDDYNKDPKKVKVDADDKDAKDKIAGLEAGPYSATITAEVDGSQARKDIAALEAPGTKRIQVILEQAIKNSGQQTTDAYKSNFAWGYLPGNNPKHYGGNSKGNVLTKQATGTRNHPGGLSLVNDGSGPELIIDNGQAFIAGNGKPTVVGLNKGAKVFTASETRNILGGGSIPAYASGTTGGSGLSFSNTTTKKPSIKVTNQKIKKTAKKSSSSKKSATKEDKESFSNLASMVDYIIGRIGTALDEQLDVIDAQIEALNKAREAAEEQNKLEELQKNVTDALNERTVRYLGEDGKWHWMADQKNVQQAQKALKEYQDELAFNAQVNELEHQKKALQDEYNEITKTWSGIKDAVNTPTGSLSDLINQVLANGTAQQKAGAQAVSGTLISDITESVYTKNYDEALSAIAKATAGNPVMPGSGAASLASLIATAGAGATEASITEALKTAASPSASITGSNGSLAAGNNTNINYFIDGIKLGEGMENMPLSSIMKNLSVYTNTGVN